MAESCLHLCNWAVLCPGQQQSTGQWQQLGFQWQLLFVPPCQISTCGWFPNPHPCPFCNASVHHPLPPGHIYKVDVPSFRAGSLNIPHHFLNLRQCSQFNVNQLAPMLITWQRAAGPVLRFSVWEAALLEQHSPLERTTLEHGTLTGR